eukprot:gene18597-20463_t
MDSSINEEEGHEGIQKHPLEGDDTREEIEYIDNSVSMTESTSTLMSSGRQQLMMAVNKSLQSIDPESLLRPVQQCINCNGDETSFSIYGNDVSVYPSDQNSTTRIASNKIRISQVCKFDWEQRYYFGNLVASNKLYVAYVVGVRTNRDEHIRVINHHTSSRVLLKGFDGKVTDLEFGGPQENHLACLDVKGNLRIYHLYEENDLVNHLRQLFLDDVYRYDLILEVHRPDSQDTEFSLVSWAPMLYEEDHDDDEHELIVAVSRGESAEVYSVNTILSEYGSHCDAAHIEKGMKQIQNGHTKPITKMVVSPNLEVLATSSLDGCVKFWDINFENKENSSCLHDWQPHDGEPVTSLFFCDNQYARDEMSSSWRFLITGANYNNEIKVWCAVSWKCLQVIRFCSDANLSFSDDRNPPPCLKPVLDKSASYFVSTDIKRNVVYLLQLYQNNLAGTAHFTSLTEALQKLHIKYSPSCSMPPATPSICTAASSDDPLSVRDAMSDITEGQCSLASDLDDVDSFATANFRLHAMQQQDRKLQETSAHSSMTSVTAIQSPIKPDEVKRDSVVDSDEYRSGSIVSESEEKKAIGRRESEDDDDVVDGKTPDGSPKESYQSQGDTITESQSDKSYDTLTEKSHDSVSESASESVSSSRSKSLVAALEEARLAASNDFKSPRSGTFTILKRPTAELKAQENVDGKESFSSISSVSDSSLQAEESAATDHVAAAQSPVSGKEATRKQTKSNITVEQTRKRGRYSPDNRADGSNFQSDALVVETEDILGLGDAPVAVVVSAEEKEAAVGTKDVLVFKKFDEVSKVQSGVPLERMMAMMEQQQQQIMRLTDAVQTLSVQLQKQTEKSEIQNQKQSEERDQMKTALHVMQKNSTSNLNKAVKEVSKAYSQRLDAFTNNIQSSMQHTQEKQLQALQQAVSSSLTGKLDKLVKSEMKMSILPNVNKVVTHAMDQVSNFVAEKLAAVEKILRDEVSALVRSKSVAESIGFTAATILEGHLPNAYRDAFRNILIPSYEQACKEMFNQINKSFEQGTKSYIEKFDAQLESKKQKQSEKRDPVLEHLQGLVQTLGDTCDRLAGSESNLEVLMQKHMKDAMARSKTELVALIDEKMSEAFLPPLKKEIGSMLEQVKDDISSLIRASAVNQFGQVPVESSDFVNVYETIDKYVDECDYENAFKVALSASDLDVVVYVCRKVDHEELFNTDSSTLNQPIILSLIQQLSADLSNDTEIKENYLLAATCELDHKNEITAEHMPAVLGNLIKQADQTVQHMRQHDTTNPNIKQLKSLSHIAKKLLDLCES